MTGRLAGFRVLLLGLLGFGALLVATRPVVRYEDCPNYGGNGNASAFDNPTLDVVLLLLTAGWLLLVVGEQFLPSRRAGLDRAVRGTVAVTAALVASCGLLLQVLTVCH